MNKITYNNKTINTTSKGVFIDDIFVPYKKGMKGNSTSIINGKFMLMDMSLKQENGREHLCHYGI